MIENKHIESSPLLKIYAVHIFLKFSACGRIKCTLLMTLQKINAPFFLRTLNVFFFAISFIVKFNAFKCLQTCRQQRLIKTKNKNKRYMKLLCFSSKQTGGGSISDTR